MLSFAIIRRIQLARVIVLAFAGFIFNTTEFIPVALLSDIAQSFAISIPQAGLMITVYAWIVSLMSLPFMLATANLERRSLLIKLLILFIVSHIISVIAWDFWVLLLGRIGVAIAHAVFWAITASLAVRVAPKDKKAQALGLLAIGSALAMVLGLPLGRLVGQLLDWRSTFALITLIACVILLLLYKLLPRLVAKNAGSLKSLPILCKRPLLVGIYILTILFISSHFTAYSYVEPFVLRISAMSESMATLVLLMFGLSGIFASLLFNRFYRLQPQMFLILSVFLLLSALGLLHILSKQQEWILLLVFLWGIGISGISLSLQIRVLQLAPDATDVAMAIYSGIYNIGIGGGALLGNIVMQSFGLSYIGYSGALIGILGVVLFVFLQLNYAQKIEAK